MDAIDREILSQLQQDGRLSHTDLAHRVGLSLSACHRRVKELEHSGAIAEYRAVIDPASVGKGFEALVFATLRYTEPEIIRDFEQALLDNPAIVEAERLFGTPDFMFRVLAQDLADYQRIYDEDLGSLPGVEKLSSTLVMKRIMPHKTVPVG